MGAVLTQKTAIVTGANRPSGIGYQLVKQLLAKGNSVVATTRDAAKASHLQQLERASGGRLTITQLDVSDPGSIADWALGLQDKHSHFDLVVNNAGTLSSEGLQSVASGDMLSCFTVNTIGPLLVVQQLHRLGLIGQPGSIVANMTSEAGSIDDNGSGGYYAYRASKAALNIVTKSLSLDLQRDGITSVLLHPGFVQTEMVGGAGLIDSVECVEGLLRVLESDLPLNGRWYDYSGKELKW